MTMIINDYQITNTLTINRKLSHYQKMIRYLEKLSLNFIFVDNQITFPSIYLSINQITLIFILDHYKLFCSKNHLKLSLLK